MLQHCSCLIFRLNFITTKCYNNKWCSPGSAQTASSSTTKAAQGAQSQETRRQCPNQYFQSQWPSLPLPGKGLKSGFALERMGLSHPSTGEQCTERLMVQQGGSKVRCWGFRGTLTIPSCPPLHWTTGRDRTAELSRSHPSPHSLAPLLLQDYSGLGVGVL